MGASPRRFDEPLNVAVIGAGAAGLVTAYELLAAGHRVTVFEQSDQVGGLWNYTDDTEDDPLGLQPSVRIHGSLYASLRVNLPRDLMAFEGYTFDDAGGGSDRWPRYPHHRRVLEYLQRFAADTGVAAHVHLGHQVQCVTPISQSGWQVDGDGFDAVAVCNGHFSEPLVPPILGFDSFPGTALHSHNYRHREAFTNARVVLFGSSVSGNDLARELSHVASDVYLSGTLFNDATPLGCQTESVKRCPPVASVNGADITLANGETIHAVDALLFCTGYHYRFPFLSPSLVTVEENWVGDLYRLLIPVDAPRCAFIGLPFRIVPFPLFQRQARWFARLLDGRFKLPPRARRQQAYTEEIAHLQATGVPKRHYHLLGDRQIGYLSELARQCGDAPVPDWFVALWREHSANARRHPADYRERALRNRGPTRTP